MSDNYTDTFLDDDANNDSDDSDDSDYAPAIFDDTMSELDSSDTESHDAMDVEEPTQQPGNTQKLRDCFEGVMVEKVRKILDVMDGEGINLTMFLDAVSWGDADCVADARIRYQRSGLMASTELPVILQRWWKPPRMQGSKHRRPKGAREIMETFAMDCLSGRLEAELEASSSVFESQSGNSYDVSEAELTEIDFNHNIALVRKTAPSLWKILRSLAYSAEQQERNKHKDPDKIVFMIISMISYTRTHFRSRFQKFFAIYFKFRGLSAKGFDTLHAMALTMSHKWTCNAVARISKQAMEEMNSLKDCYPWLLSYNNVNIPFRVFSQRLDNHGEFGTGTAATVYIKRNATPLSSSANQTLQETRKEGMKSPITEVNILDLATESYPRIQARMKEQVLKFLLDAPEFNYPTYTGRKNPKLQRAKPQSELPCGTKHITLQYLLGTVNIPEASYDDNSKLIKEWLRQLGLNSSEMQVKVGLEKIIAWIGDQLTMDRLRNLFKFRAEDLNSYDRLDWLILIFGWLHLMMAYANSFHKQYLGTARGRGLSQAIDLLNKKGLGTTSTQGPFYHDLNELLYHMAEAHLREDWLAVSGAKSIEELRLKSPEELLLLANKIVEERASSEAMVRLGLKPEPQQDEIFKQMIMFNRDVLEYIVLDQAIKCGDIGIMEDSLPHLFARFIGGKNSNYTVEVLELLQGLHREWPPEIKDFVRQNCWLVNYTGRRSDFLPIDMSQEHNIKRIKVTHRSQGPSVDWDYLKKLHPAIHVIEAVGTHAENQFKTMSRGKKHTVPRKIFDVQTLQNSYHSSNIHKYVAGRKSISKRDLAKDFASNGIVELMTGKILARWTDGRSFERSTDQEWDFSREDDMETDEDPSTDDSS